MHKGTVVASFKSEIIESLAVRAGRAPSYGAHLTPNIRSNLLEYSKPDAYVPLNIGNTLDTLLEPYALYVVLFGIKARTNN